VIGAEVNIDTSEARRTVNAPLPVCRCLATARYAYFMDVTITGPAGACGSLLKLNVPRDSKTFSEITGGGNETCKRTERKKVKVYTDATWNITLAKLQEPYEADFCVTVKIG